MIPGKRGSERLLARSIRSQYKLPKGDGRLVSETNLQTARAQSLPSAKKMLKLTHQTAEVHCRGALRSASVCSQRCALPPFVSATVADCSTEAAGWQLEVRDCVAALVAERLCAALQNQGLCSTCEEVVEIDDVWRQACAAGGLVNAEWVRRCGQLGASSMGTVGYFSDDAQGRAECAGGSGWGGASSSIYCLKAVHEK